MNIIEAVNESVETVGIKMSLTSHELHVMQLRYDLLHHKNRILFYEQKENITSSEKELLKQSRRVVSGKIDDGYRSVDLDDHDYLQYLDKWEKENNAG